ncbi:MAG: LysM peptidoglycan-binding domain-containing protein [Clostridia bacterium]|nr:LysM peptidoglycan-binding domain-containing protein [Clostridia bacterium]
MTGRQRRAGSGVARLLRAWMLPVALAGLAVATFLPAQPAQATSFYTVQPGDTLYTIGVRNGVDYRAIMSANGLTSSWIYPGQRLLLPGPGAVYTVRPGDTLWLIAQRFGVTVGAIQLANGLTSSWIYPGQVLSIPGGASASGAAGAMAAGGAGQAGPVPGPATSGGKTVVQLAPGERDLLARLVTAEAGGEPFLAQVGVAAVVLNRVRSPLFPDTVTGVIYQVDAWGNYQFTPVLNGWINRPATATAYQAVDEALAGVDPTGGALYFWATGEIGNPYLLSLPVSAQIGHVTFAL